VDSDDGPVVLLYLLLPQGKMGYEGNVKAPLHASRPGAGLLAHVI